VSDNGIGLTEEELRDLLNNLPNIIRELEEMVNPLRSQIIPHGQCSR